MQKALASDHAMSQAALQSSSATTVSRKGSTNSLTTSFVEPQSVLVPPRNQKGSPRILGEPIFMHPRETPKAFENMDSFHFIGWFMPVGSEPTACAQNDDEQQREIVRFPKFMDDTEVRCDRCDAFRAGRRRRVENEENRPTDAAQVPVLRGPHAKCEANGPDGVPEGQIDEVFTVESLCTPCVVAKALSETTPAQKAHVHD